MEKEIDNNSEYCAECGVPLLYPDKPCPKCNRSICTEKTKKKFFAKPKIIILSVIVSIVFIFTVYSISSAVNNKSFDELYSSAENLYSSGELDASLEKLNKAYEINPNSYRLNCFMGIIYGNKGNFKESIEYFEKAIKINPNDFTAYSLIADVYNSQGIYPFAIKYYTKVLEFSKLPDGAREYYGNQLSVMKQKQSEIDSVQEEVLADGRPNTNLKLDNRDWKMITNTVDDLRVFREYILSNENIDNGWSEIITFEYISKNKINYSANQYLHEIMSLMEQNAQNLGKTFSTKIISQKDDEIIHQWSFENEEFEVARLIQTKNGLTHIHYARKKPFQSEADVQKWVKILKSM